MSRCILLGLLLLSGPALAESWEGKDVVAINEGALIERPGNIHSKLPFLSVAFRVEKDLGETLEIFGGKIRRADVLPSDDVIAHFTRLVTENPSATNYSHRAMILLANFK